MWLVSALKPQGVIEYVVPIFRKTANHIKYQYGADCNAGTIGYMYVVLYDHKGSVIYSNNNGKFLPVIPGSNGQLIYDVMCQEQEDTSSNKSNESTSAE